jgi:ribosomal protein L37AE/L43A
MTDVRHRSPWEAADCPDCGRGLFVDEHPSGSGWVCHDCEVRFADADDHARGT